MVKEINKDITSLSQKSDAFNLEDPADMELLNDMIDTANFHKDYCVGLAAIQIGVAKRVILVLQGNNFVPFINPMIIHKSPKTYMVNEGCLSLEGTRRVKRHYSIKVVWTDTAGKKHLKDFNGFTAQVLQHEIDHCDGVLI